MKGRYGFDYVQHRHRLDEAADPQAGRAEAQGLHRRSGELARGVPRGDVGGSARRRGATGCATSATPTASARSPASARRRAPTKRRISSRSSCAPGSARTTSTTARVCATRRASRRSWRASIPGAVSNQVRDVANAEVIFVIGANPTVNHPVAATWMKNAAKSGAKLIVADPRRSDLARHATYYLQFNPDTDVALLNALLHVIVEEGLVDESFIRDRTSGYAALAENVRKFSPEAMAPICGIDAQTIREVARLYATSKGSMILWGMGISQHVHGTDNARCLIALALSTGQIGKPGSRPASAARPEQRAGRVRLGPDPDVLSGLPARQHAGGARSVSRSCGRPARSRSRPDRRRDHERREEARDPRDVHHGREPGDVGSRRRSRARSACRRSITSSCRTSSSPRPRISPTSCLPATAWPEKVGTVTNTDRMVQLGRKAIEPPGDAREDFWLLIELGRRMGLDWSYTHPRDVFNEMRQCMDSIAGITWERLETRVVGHLSLREGRRPGRSRSCSSTGSRRRAAAAGSSRRISSPPPNVLTPSIRWCSSPAGSSNTGTPDR